MRIMVATDGSSGGADAVEWLVHFPLPADAAVVSAIPAAADALIREAVRTGSDLIVVGSLGKGAMKRLMLGSVSESVLRHAGCPVLIARRAE